MKEELKELINKLSVKQFNDLKQIYLITRKIKGNTVDEFVANIPDAKTVIGVIKLCKKELGYV